MQHTFSLHIKEGLQRFYGVASPGFDESLAIHWMPSQPETAAPSKGASTAPLFRHTMSEKTGLAVTVPICWTIGEAAASPSWSEPGEPEPITKLSLYE